MSAALAIVGCDQWCGDIEEVVLFHIDMNGINSFASNSCDR